MTNNLGDWNTSPTYGEILVGTYDFKVRRDDGNAILTKTNPHAEITWPLVKAEIDKL